MKATINVLTPVLRGWISYFRLTEVRGVLEELDGWIKRKLRCLLWRQWKRPGTRTKNLQRAGLSKDRAMISAYNNHGPWWNSGASHMNQAIKNVWFRRLGLISLLEQQRQFQS
ncbi:group II intron maturase-specific domain-containing protein [Escherichia coli]|uniref:group II intron maturase-specific domain-containing protein n=1 Tax=Escherichia coli TaxID=562 RepID=UPI00201D0F8B|nr:group II intron maturase-specific domain-containing protein [Escherichia coli]